MPCITIKAKGDPGSAMFCSFCFWGVFGLGQQRVAMLRGQHSVGTGIAEDVT